MFRQETLEQFGSTGGIENSLHWRLDVAMNEDQDRTRIGHGRHNLAALRRMAINGHAKGRLQRLPARKVHTRRMGP